MKRLAIGAGLCVLSSLAAIGVMILGAFGHYREGLVLLVVAVLLLFALMSIIVGVMEPRRRSARKPVVFRRRGEVVLGQLIEG